MSDALKTAVNLVQSFTFSDGMQPSAKQFENIFSGLTQGLNIFSNVIGPALNSSVSVLTKNKIVSSHKYNSMMIDTERSNFESDAQESILNTFNLTRILGSHSSLNPLYLPGSVHLVASQSSGYPLATDVKVQQLPFPPTDGYDFEIDDDGRTWVQAANAAAASIVTGAYSFYIDGSGTIYTNRLFTAGANIKYDLRIPNTYGPLGSSYNMIPDPSIETLLDEDILSRTGDGTYGRVNLSLRSTGSDYSEWTLVLPPVISLKDPLLTSSTQGVANQGFEPFGVFESSNGKKYYGLNSELYLQSAGGLIDNNTLVLFNAESGKSYFLDWTSANLPGEEAKRTFYASGSTALLTLFKNDAGNLISSNGGYNTKSFYIFAFGTNISDTLAQVNLNFAKHKHDGSDSYRIHHNDLLGTQNGIQGFGSQTGAYNGLNFITYNRQLAFSGIDDNVHPQYFHRLGFLHGGTAGKYSDTHLYGVALAKKVDWNFLHGDMVFSPIEKVSRPMLYENSGDSSADPDKNKIDWDLTFDSNEYKGTKYLGNLRSHSLMFGVPLIMNQTSGSNPDGDQDLEPSYNGAVRVSYENGIFYNDTLYDVANQKYRLSKHGFIPGDETGIDGNLSPAFRGLNIGWGNLFFGHREDIFGGRMSGMWIGKTEASAFWRTAEFNIITTANSQAGKNTNSKIKEGYNYRDGFTVRALKGSSIWLSTGAESADISDISTGKNSLNIPGTIALEASYPSSRGSVLGSETGVLSLNTLISSDANGDAMSSGSGIFLAPGPRINTSTGYYENPWVARTGENYKFASLWNGASLTELCPVVTGGIIDGFNAGPGPLLDIFALAPDRQKTNATSNGNIPVGTDSDLLGWVFGRPFIRGTYGINFCANSSFVSVDTEFKSGYNRKVASQPWGPTRAILKTATNEYIHREFKFWGKNYVGAPDSAADSLENTIGGNINLLYNFGRNYTRFGRSETWSNSTSLSGQTGSSQWTNSRRIALGSSKPEDYGSAIRQASFVDAFAGVRNDPYQPFIAEYVVPFVADYQIAESGAAYYGQTTSVADLLSEGTFVIGDAIENALSSSTAQPYLGWKASSQKYYLALFNSQDNSYTTRLDSMVRGSEEIYIEKSGERVPFSYAGTEYPQYDTHFPQSLIDFKVNLHYYIGQKNTGSIGTGDTDSPSEASDYNGLDYLNVIYRNTHKMVPAIKGNIIAGSSLSTDNNVIPIVFTSNNGQSRYPLNTIQVNKIVTETETTYETEPSSFIPPYSSGYDAALGVVPATNLMTTYRNKFPLFESSYGTFMSNKQFCILLNIQAKPVITAQNLPVPYQIYKGFGGEVYIRFSGWVTVKVKTADAF